MGECEVLGKQIQKSLQDAQLVRGGCDAWLVVLFVAKPRFVVT